MQKVCTVYSNVVAREHLCALGGSYATILSLISLTLTGIKAHVYSTEQLQPMELVWRITIEVVYVSPKVVLRKKVFLSSNPDNVGYSWPLFCCSTNTYIPSYDTALYLFLLAQSQQ